MFCPKCGNGDQEKDTYCRQCGEYLPDVDNLGKGRHRQTPEDQFKLSLVFNVMTSIAAISTAIALIVVHFGTDAHPVIYAATSLLGVISVWQIISFFNNLKLRKRFIRKDKSDLVTESPASVGARETNELLPEANFEDMTPASVTEHSTRKLDDKVFVSAKPKKQTD